MSPESNHCDCRLCDWRGSVVETPDHFCDIHGFDEAAIRSIEVQLHSSKDTPEHSENTLGLYHGERLLMVVIQRCERAADDPMRFGG